MKEISCSFSVNLKNFLCLEYKSKTFKERIMLLSKCAICNSKKSRFIKKQEARGLLSKLEIKSHLSKSSLLGDILF